MEVRKSVTVVFTDVAGSTALGERLDPESLRQVMSLYFDRMRDVIERHGGTVEKFIGDAVMAVFGIPVLHEDDALRAVTAATEMREALSELNAELESEWAVQLESRTGVNTGDVVAGDPASGEAFVSGDAVNVAARLEQSAEPGEILVAAATMPLVRDAVSVEPVPPMALKGKAGPASAFRLLGVTRGAAPFARRLDSPLVGRDRELLELEAAFERSVEQPCCELVTVLGDAGVGKSRLTHEFVAHVGSRARILRGRCLPYGEGITFWPIAEVVKEAAGVTETDPPEEAGSKVIGLLGDEEDATLVGHRLTAAVGLGGESGALQETFWAVRRLLEILAAERPLIVEFDDIHWAEPVFLDLLEYLVGFGKNHPLLLLCLARPDLREARPGWGGTSIALEPLGEDESEKLIDGLLGEAGLSEAARDRIAEAAEGNPLFVEEMLRMLIDDGLLRRENGHWVPVRDLSDVSPPATIQSLLAARLDRLDGEERGVMQRGSVVGKVFWWGAVTELSPDERRSDVGGHLQTLLRKELIRPGRSTFAGEDAFRFSHILVRDAAYESIPKRVRVDLHERFAAWLERTAGPRVAEYEEILAHHLERAYRYLGELGPVGDRGRELAERAADRLLSSGSRALERGDVGAAVNLLDRAVSLLPADDPRRREVFPDLVEALYESGELVRASAVVEMALGEAATAGDRRAEAHLRMSQLLLQLSTDPEGKVEETRRETERLLPVFEETDDDRGLARAWRLVGLTYLMLGRAGQMDEAMLRALEHARRAGHGRVAHDVVLWLITANYLGSRPVADAEKRLDELLAEAPLDRHIEALALSARSLFAAMHGEGERALEMMRRAVAILEDLGMRLTAAAIVASSGWPLLMFADDPATAEREISWGYDILEEAGEKGFLSTAAAYLAESLYRQERDDEAERFTRVSEELAASDDLASQMLWRSVRAKVFARRGEAWDAVRLARAAVAVGDRTDFSATRGDLALDLAETLRLTGRTPEARAAAEDALAHFQRKGDGVSAARARRMLGEWEA